MIAEDHLPVRNNDNKQEEQDRKLYAEESQTRNKTVEVDKEEKEPDEEHYDCWSEDEWKSYAHPEWRSVFQ